MVCITDKGIAVHRIAVATKNGVLVDMHFGQATEFYIYESDGTETRLLETRPVSKYCHGPGEEGLEEKWDSVIGALRDCEAVLTLRIGMNPEKRLRESGIKSITACDRVENAVKEAARTFN